MRDTRKRESIYQPEQAGLKFAEKPVFATRAEERRRRQHLHPVWEQLLRTQPDMLDR